MIGVGTGFNAALALGTETGVIVPPAECGHTSMPVGDSRAFSLAEYIKTRTGFASIEDVLSGRGLENVYAWAARERGESGSRRAADIMSACEQGDPIAEETVETVVKLYGAVAGDLALTLLPVGGLYLIGGVTRSLAPYFASLGFQAAFRDKGRFEGFLSRFSVSVIEDDGAALLGLAQHINDR